MAALYPQITATLYPLAGSDEYGRASYAAAQTIRVGVVRLVASSEKTSVRVDSSASRGRAEEPIDDAVLLFMPAIEPVSGSKVEVNNQVLRVTSIHPRYDLGGALRHWQVGLTRHAE